MSYSLIAFLRRCGSLGIAATVIVARKLYLAANHGFSALRRLFLGACNGTTKVIGGIWRKILYPFLTCVGYYVGLFQRTVSVGIIVILVAVLPYLAIFRLFDRNLVDFAAKDSPFIAGLAAAGITVASLPKLVPQFKTSILNLTQPLFDYICQTGSNPFPVKEMTALAIDLAGVSLALNLVVASAKSAADSSADEAPSIVAVVHSEKVNVAPPPVTPASIEQTKPAFLFNYEAGHFTKEALRKFPNCKDTVVNAAIPAIVGKSSFEIDLGTEQYRRLDSILRSLSACASSDQKVELSVYGYASSAPFKNCEESDDAISKDLNTRLAEERAVKMADAIRKWDISEHVSEWMNVRRESAVRIVNDDGGTDAASSHFLNQSVMVEVADAGKCSFYLTKSLVAQPSLAQPSLAQPSLATNAQ